MNNEIQEKKGRGKRAGTPDIAPHIRRAFARAIEQLDKDGTPLYMLVKNSLQTDLVSTLAVLAKFLPKERIVTGEISVEHEHQHTHVAVSATLDFIEGAVGAGTHGALAESGEARPILSAAVHTETPRH